MNKAAEQDLAAIVESAIKLRIPPLYFEILMNKLHQLSELDAKLILTHLQSLDAQEACYHGQAARFKVFWEELALKVDCALQAEARLIADQLTTMGDIIKHKQYQNTDIPSQKKC